jgi:hypothetical protein
MDLIKKMTDEDQDLQKMNDFSLPTSVNYKTVDQDWRTHFWWSGKKREVTKVEGGVWEMKIWTSEIKAVVSGSAWRDPLLYWLNHWLFSVTQGPPSPFSEVSACTLQYQCPIPVRAKDNSLRHHCFQVGCDSPSFQPNGQWRLFLWT